MSYAEPEPCSRKLRRGELCGPPREWGAFTERSDEEVSGFDLDPDRAGLEPEARKPRIGAGADSWFPGFRLLEPFKLKCSRSDVVGAHEARPYQVRVGAGLVPALGVAPVSDRRPASRRLALRPAIACGALNHPG